MGDLFFPDFDKVKASVADISQDHIRFLLQNKIDRSIFLEDMQCSIDIPIYLPEIYEAELSTLAAEGGSEKAISAIGTFVFFFDFDTGASYLPGEVKMVSSTESRWVGPSSLEIIVIDPNHNSCILNGITDEGKTFGHIIYLDAIQLTGFDIDTTLSDESLGGLSDASRAALLEKIRLYANKKLGLN